MSAFTGTIGSTTLALTLPSANQIRRLGDWYTVSHVTSLPDSSTYPNLPAPRFWIETHLAPRRRQAVTARSGLSSSQKYCSGMHANVSAGPRATTVGFSI